MYWSRNTKWRWIPWQTWSWAASQSRSILPVTETVWPAPWLDPRPGASSCHRQCWRRQSGRAHLWLHTHTQTHIKWQALPSLQWQKHMQIKKNKKTHTHTCKSDQNGTNTDNFSPTSTSLPPHESLYIHSVTMFLPVPNSHSNNKINRWRPWEMKFTFRQPRSQKHCLLSSILTCHFRFPQT